jgi:hypothetical protein
MAKSTDHIPPDLVVERVREGLVNLLSVEALIRQERVSTDRDRFFMLPPFP